MKSNNKALAAALVLATMLAVIVAALCWPGEPAHQGKRLSEWLDYYPTNVAESKAAIRAIGPDALPFLVSWVGLRESSFKSTVVQWLNRLPGVNLPLHPASKVRFWAAQGIIALGTNATPWIPQLAALLNDPQTAKDAAAALSDIGPAAVPALTNAARHTDQDVRKTVATALLKVVLLPEGQPFFRQLAPLFLTNLHDDFYLIRASSAAAVAVVADAETGVAALLPNLEDPDSYVRAMTAQALGQYGTRASPALPKLHGLVNSTNAFERGRAEAALKRIAPEASRL